MNPADPLVLGILGSGAGSNFVAIANAIRAGTLDAQIGCVISDLPDAPILARASALDIPAYSESCEPFRTKLDGEAQQRVIECLRAHAVNTVVLAGFMRIIKPALLDAFPRRILNIHPSLLPAFPGLKAWEQALAYGVRVSGCTVHFVDDGMDTGPIILQRPVPVEDADRPQDLHARIQAAEHRAYPEALQLLAEGRLRLQGRRVRILPASP